MLLTPCFRQNISVYVNSITLNVWTLYLIYIKRKYNFCDCFQWLTSFEAAVFLEACMLFVKANSYQKWLKNLFTMTAMFLSNSNSRFAELLNIRSSISYTLYFQFIFLWHGQYFLRSDILLLLLLTENQWVKEFQNEVKSDLRKKMLSSHSRLWQPGVQFLQTFDVYLNWSIS